MNRERVNTGLSFPTETGHTCANDAWGRTDMIRTALTKPDAGNKLNNKPPMDIMAMWLFLGTTVSNLSDVNATRERRGGESHRCFICLLSDSLGRPEAASESEASGCFGSSCFSEGEAIAVRVEQTGGEGKPSRQGREIK